MIDEPVPKTRGFAGMSPERRREIASKGGKSVPREKRTYSRDRNIASSSGKKGGAAVPAEKRSFSVNRELAVTSGKLTAARVRHTSFDDAA